MNKIFKGLLAAAIALSSNAIASDHSNKTFLMPRPGGSVDLPMEHTAWDNFINRENKKGKKSGFGGNLNITGFYNSSECGKDLGKYFGPCGKADCPPKPDCPTTKCPSKGCSGFTFSLQRADARFTPGPVTANTTTSSNFDIGDATDSGKSFAKESESVDLGYIIHNANFVGSATAKDKVTLGFNPEHNVWGVRFDYYQSLDSLLKGLYLRANLPVVQVENNLNFAVCAQDNAATRTAVQDYFKGNKVVIPFNVAAAVDTTTNPDTNVAGGINQQERLCKAKICGKQSESGVADIDLALGYKLLNKAKYHVALGFAITIPTGNTPDGRWLFEPVVGNGGHFGIGFDFDGDFKIWDNDDQNLKLYYRMKYRYLLEDTEHRVLGLGTDGGPSCPAGTGSCPPAKCPPANQRPWGQYHLLGCKDRVDLRPAANVLCLKVDVTPGSQFDGILGLSYNYAGFNFDLGYNLYYRESERVRIKGGSKDDCKTSCPTTPSCPDLSIYSVAARGHLTATKTTISVAAGNNIRGTGQHPDFGIGGDEVKFNQARLSVVAGANNQSSTNALTTINTHHPSSVDGNVEATAKLNDGTKIVRSAAETPSQLTHSIYGGLAYGFLDWDYPVLLRLGAKYEWKDDNAAIERFGIWGGIGIGF